MENDCGSRGLELSVQQVHIRQEIETLEHNFHSNLIPSSYFVSMPRRRVHAQNKHLQPFERGHAICLKEAEWSNRSIVRHLGWSDATIRRCLQELVNHGRTETSRRQWTIQTDCKIGSYSLCISNLKYSRKINDCKYH